MCASWVVLTGNVLFGSLGWSAPPTPSTSSPIASATPSRAAESVRAVPAESQVSKTESSVGAASAGSTLASAALAKIPDPKIPAAPAPSATAKPDLSGSPTHSIRPGGTYIHVKNGTNAELKFDLFFETPNGRIGKFDSRLSVKPGQTAIWRLKAPHVVRNLNHDGKEMYRVGVVGVDSEGRSYRWGVVGGHGMQGFERQSVETSDTHGAQTYRNIHVRPVGSL